MPTSRPVSNHGGIAARASIGRHTISAWTIAWGLTGIALYVSGVFNSPRTGPLWVALVGGAIPWAVAGTLTFRSPSPETSNRLNPAVLLIWALTYLLAFGLAAFAASALDIAFGGFFFMLFGWSIGGAVGAFASTWLLTDQSHLKRSILAAAIWLLGFFVGAFIALMGLYLGPELGKITIGSLIGQPAALSLGAGLGCAVGGLIAAGIAVGLTRLAWRKS